MYNVQKNTNHTGSVTQTNKSLFGTRHFGSKKQSNHTVLDASATRFRGFLSRLFASTNTKEFDVVDPFLSDEVPPTKHHLL